MISQQFTHNLQRNREANSLSRESNSHLQGSVMLFPFNIFLPVLTLSSLACAGASYYKGSYLPVAK